MGDHHLQGRGEVGPFLGKDGGQEGGSMVRCWSVLCRRTRGLEAKVKASMSSVSGE